MTVLTVRNLDEGTRQRLKAQAAAHGRSMEAEARAILAAAVTPTKAVQTGLGSRIRALFTEEAAPEFTRMDERARRATFEP